MGLMDLAEKVTGSALSFSKLSGSPMSLQKAQLLAYDKPNGTLQKDESISFFLNPTSVQVKRAVKVETVETTSNHTKETRVANSEPVGLSFGKLVFDTYEERTSVRKKYIDKLEKLLVYYEKTHSPHVVQFVWGEFNKSTWDASYTFYVKSMDVTYTMFLPSGLPVRAEVALELVQTWSLEDQQEEHPLQSPDHAKVRTVRRGDTLQGLAAAEYDDHREWRRIAAANGLSDPMALEPGMKLLVPPIL